MVAATVVTRLPGLISGRAFNVDEATLATGGRVLAHGGSLYVDFIDRKPPLPFALYAIVQRLTGTDDLRPVRLLVAVGVALTAMVVASEAGRRWGQRAAWVAGLALVLGASALGPHDAQAANFELFALLPIAVAVVAAARGRAVVAGVALAAAVLCKQPAAVTAVPVAWSLWRVRQWRGVAVGAGAGAMAAVAMAAPFGIALVAKWALLGTGGYLAISLADLGTAAGRLLALLALTAGFWGGAWLLAVAPAEPRSGVREPPVRSLNYARTYGQGDRDLWLLLGASALGVAAGFRFFPHYLIQLLPALALLAGRGAARRPSWVRPAAAWAGVASSVALILAAVAAAQGEPRLQVEVSSYVRAHSRPGERILVWGNVPEIYWRSARQPAGGFPHTEFVTGYSGGRRHHPASEANVPDRDLYRRYVARLRRERPVLVLDTAIAKERGGPLFPLARFPAITSFLRSDYHRVATVDKVVVYRLRTAALPP
ncbi:MAG: glycosyltransferase [Acidimicrobiales bacterium]